MSLRNCKIIAFVPTKNPARARKFYESTLGLRCRSEDQFALVFDANGTMLRVTPVGKYNPAPFTMLGWEVADIEAVARKLAKKRVAFQRYEGLSQDRPGIWTSPSGSRVAWFKDPDGNLLSISQHSKKRALKQR